MLREHQETRDDALGALSDKVTRLIQEMEVLKNNNNNNNRK
jgi:hypothetical protein